MFQLLKIVATRGEIFSLKFTKYRLVAGLRPDPLGELKRSPMPPSRNKGSLLLRGGHGRREEGEGRRRVASWLSGDGRPCCSVRYARVRGCQLTHMTLYVVFSMRR